MPSTRRRAPKRIMFTVQGGDDFDSHLRWIVPVAHACKRLGHEVLVAAPDALRHTVVATYGLLHAAAGEDWTGRPEVAHRLSDVLLRHGNTDFCRVLLSEYFAGPPALRMARDVLAISHQWHPDVLWRDCTDFGGLLAAFHLGLEPLSLDNGFARMLALNHDWMLPALTAHAAELGLNESLPLPGQETILTPAPRDFLLHDLPGFPIECHRPDPPVREGERLPTWITKIPVDRPLIYVSLGSMITCAPGALSDLAVNLYGRIVEALTPIHCTAIVAVGRGNEAKLRTPAAHIHVTTYTPQPLLMQAGVALFVTHGGRGALRDAHGVPLVIIPICSDQPDNAKRCAELNVAEALTPDASVDQIHDALSTVLRRASYQDNARRWQRKILALPPLSSVLPRLLNR